MFSWGVHHMDCKMNISLHKCRVVPHAIPLISSIVPDQAYSRCKWYRTHVFTQLVKWISRDDLTDELFPLFAAAKLLPMQLFKDTPISIGTVLHHMVTNNLLPYAINDTREFSPDTKQKIGLGPVWMLLCTILGNSSLKTPDWVATVSMRYPLAERRSRRHNYTFGLWSSLPLDTDPTAYPGWLTTHAPLLPVPLFYKASHPFDPFSLQYPATFHPLTLTPTQATLWLLHPVGSCRLQGLPLRDRPINPADILGTKVHGYLAQLFSFIR